MSEESRRYWDEQAATFDDEADHGLREPSFWGKDVADERYLLVSPA